MGSSTMKRYIDFIYKFQKPLLVLFILINITAIIGVFNLKIETNFDIFKIEGSIFQKHLDTLAEEFPTSDQMIVMIEDVDLQPEKVADFETFLNTMTNISYFKGIDTKIDLPLPTPIDLDIEELSAIKTIDGKTYGIITIFPAESFGFSDLKAIESHLEDASLTFYIGGDLYMQNKIFDYLLFILILIPPSAMFILFNIFRIQMKSIKGTILSVLPAGIAALWTLGFAGLFGKDISILTVLAPIFTIIIGSADGLHFISHVQEHLEDGHNMRVSLEKSLKMVGVPMIITTVTSVVGFASLIFMNTKAIYDLAIYASIGIALAGFATWFIVPLVNSFEHLDIRKKKSNLSLDINFKKMWGIPSYVITLLLLAVSIFTIPLINTEFNQLMMYKDYTEVSKSFEKIVAVNGGAIPIFALVGHDGNPFDPAVALEVAAFSNELTDNSHISKVISLYEIVDIVKTKLPAGAPFNPDLLKNLEIYNEMVSDNYVKLIIFPKDLNNDTIESIINIADGYEGIELAGTQLTMYELNQSMVKDQKNSLMIAFTLVFLSLLISLKHFLPSLIAMVPILVTTVFLFAFLGMTGISLNLFTTTLFSITIGVGIDYAIHYTSIFKMYHNEGLSSAEAVEKAYGFSSRPIIANALGFSIGLSVLLLSPLKVHFYVSALMWVSMVLSSFLSLSLLPTLLKRLK